MSKSWACLLCHRSGDKQSREAAIEDHAQQLRDTKWNNRRCPPEEWRPSEHCPGDIRMKSSLKKPNGPIPESGVLGGDDPWI